MDREMLETMSRFHRRSARLSKAEGTAYCHDAWADELDRLLAADASRGCATPPAVEAQLFLNELRLAEEIKRKLNPLLEEMGAALKDLRDDEPEANPPAKSWRDREPLL